MAFAGLDLSLSATGVGRITEAGIGFFTLSPPKGSTGSERLDWFEARLAALLDEASPNGVAVEGYSFGSQHSQSHKIGELGGTAKLLLWRRRIPTILVPPSCVKKFATGKGACPKGAVMVSVFKRWGVECRNDNEADGVVLAKMAEAYFWGPASALTDFQRAAMQGVELLPVDQRERKAVVRVRTRPTT